MIGLPQTGSRLVIPALWTLTSFGTVTAAEPLNSLKITEVVEKVDVLNAASKRQRPAEVNAKFNVPDLLNTGANSRAEMVADDGTVTRVGSNTTFSFSPNKREINLEKGSILFHSPTGKGGGVINAGGATAGVLGTTIIVSATKDGGFKMLVLEGTAKATLPNGSTTTINAGRLVYITPGAREFAPPTSFRLQSQVAGSALVNGFREPLQSMGRIQDSMRGQEKRIAAAMQKYGGNRNGQNQKKDGNDPKQQPGGAMGEQGGPGPGPGAGPGMGPISGPPGGLPGGPMLPPMPPPERMQTPMLPPTMQPPRGQ